MSSNSQMEQRSTPLIRILKGCFANKRLFEDHHIGVRKGSLEGLWADSSLFLLAGDPRKQRGCTALLFSCWSRQITGAPHNLPNVCTGPSHACHPQTLSPAPHRPSPASRPSLHPPQLYPSSETTPLAVANKLPADKERIRWATYGIFDWGLYGTRKPLKTQHEDLRLLPRVMQSPLDHRHKKHQPRQGEASS